MLKLTCSQLPAQMQIRRWQARQNHNRNLNDGIIMNNGHSTWYRFRAVVLTWGYFAPREQVTMSGDIFLLVVS